MKTLTAVLVVVLTTRVLTGCATTERAATREVPERWSFTFDSRPWQLGHQAADGQNGVREYVLSGQTVQNWSELVTSFYADRDVALREWFEQFKHEMSRGCPSLRVSIIEETVDTMMFEWQHDGCQGYPPQHEIRRISRSKTGVLSLSFVEKTHQLSPEKRTTWIGIIKAAKVRSDV